MSGGGNIAVLLALFGESVIRGVELYLECSGAQRHAYGWQ